MKKPLILPQFTSEDEEFEFWSDLDLSDYFEPTDFKRVRFPNLQQTKDKNSIVLPLSEETDEEKESSSQ